MEQTLVLPVTDVDGRILEYTRLGLRVVRLDRAGARVELPCGVVLVLVERTAAARRLGRPRLHRRTRTNDRPDPLDIMNDFSR
jgi:hypothetical protein